MDSKITQHQEHSSSCGFYQSLTKIDQNICIHRAINWSGVL